MVVAPLRDNLVAEEATAAEQLTEEGHDDEYLGIAEAIADTVEERCPRTVGHGKRFEATHEDTVGDDKTYIHRELYADIVGKCLEELTHDGYQRSYHNQLHDDADTVGDGVAQERNDHIGHGHDNRNRKAHHDGGLELSSNRQRRTDTQYLYGNRVVHTQRSLQRLHILL